MPSAAKEQRLQKNQQLNDGITVVAGAACGTTEFLPSIAKCFRSTSPSARHNVDCSTAGAVTATVSLPACSAAQTAPSHIARNSISVQQ